MESVVLAEMWKAVYGNPVSSLIIQKSYLIRSNKFLHEIFENANQNNCCCCFCVCADSETIGIHLNKI